MVNSAQAVSEDTSSESGGRRAGGYGGKPFPSKEFLSKWRAMIESLIEKNEDLQKSGADASVVERMIGANGVFVLLNDFWHETLKEMPKLQRPEADPEKPQDIFEGWLARYNGLVEQYTDQSFSGELEQILSPWMNIVQVGQTSAGTMFNPWLESFSEWGQVSQKLSQGDLSALDQGYNLWLSSYNETLGRAFNMPAFGLTKQHAERFRRVQDEFARFTTSLPYFHHYIHQTGQAALKEVMEKVQAMKIDRPTPENIRQIYKVWLMTNEKAFFQLFQRPDFCHTTGELVHHCLRLKQQIDELTSTWCSAMSIPTNQDQDQMAMAIQLLRRKVRQQNKAIEALQQKVETLV
ncbi:MAG: hypothetical protein HKP58_04395 [Desulfatitalea sp.]|nr:hypothetical protein [Desulfatitalea sp.]NNJ99631.1 hypothetical protein [Desulfatitalea sp.]